MSLRIPFDITFGIMSVDEQAAVTYVPDNLTTWTVMEPVRISVIAPDDSLAYSEPRAVTLFRSDRPDFLIDGVWEAHSTGLTFPRWVAWRKGWRDE
jgi:hypothetical protein